MNKDTLIGGTAVILVLIGLAALLVFKPLPPKSEESLETLTLLSGSQFSEEAPYYSIRADYASTTPLMDSAGAEADAAAVAHMKSFVAESVDAFKETADFENLTAEEAEFLGLGDGRRYSLSIVYLISDAGKTLSYIFTTYQDTGGAHGNLAFTTFVFDTASGENLALSDIFVEGADYLRVLSNAARTRLPSIIGEAFADAETIALGTEPKEESFANFFFHGTDLVILFPPYQVAAYAAGPQTLRIPIEELSDILKEKYR